MSLSVVWAEPQQFREEGGPVIRYSLPNWRGSERKEGKWKEKGKSSHLSRPFHQSCSSSLSIIRRVKGKIRSKPKKTPSSNTFCTNSLLAYCYRLSFRVAANYCDYMRTGTSPSSWHRLLQSKVLSCSQIYRELNLVFAPHYMWPHDQHQQHDGATAWG